MRLAGHISVGSGTHNEDAAGIIERDGEVIAAWVLDGVTGINNRNYLEAPTDAAWIVARADHHLRGLAAANIGLPELLKSVVDRLKTDWERASRGIELPADYDPPAACLLLVKRYEEGWKALRLGDSILLTQDQSVMRWDRLDTDLAGLESQLRRDAARLRAAGMTDFGTLLQQFHTQHATNRKARNTLGNHSILVADDQALAIPEYHDLGWPRSILVCTDGFYRAVDTYSSTDDAGLVASCNKPNGVQAVLHGIRQVESEDIGCVRHPRFKPADDASAVALTTG